MNRMGHVAERRHFLEIRQRGRQKESKFFGGLDFKLQKQNAEVYTKIIALEKHLLDQAKNKQKVSMPSDLLQIEQDKNIQVHQLKHIANNLKGIKKATEIMKEK